MFYRKWTTTIKLYRSSNRCCFKMLITHLESKFCVELIQASNVFPAQLLQPFDLMAKKRYFIRAALVLFQAECSKVVGRCVSFDY